MIIPEQLRAGRAWLGLTRREYAIRYNLSLQALNEWEKKHVDHRNVPQPELWQRCLEREGIRFLFRRNIGIGIEVIEELRQPLGSGGVGPNPKYPKRMMPVHPRLRNRISPEQCRAARAWLDWSQHDLSERTKTLVNGTPAGMAALGVSAIREFEGQKPMTWDWDIGYATEQFQKAGIGLRFDQMGRAKGIIVL